MMDICEVRYEYPDDSSTVMTEDCVNKNLDETHTDISEHDKEINWDAMKTLIEVFPESCDYDET